MTLNIENRKTSSNNINSATKWENEKMTLSDRRKEIREWVLKNFKDSISDACLDYIMGEVKEAIRSDIQGKN